MSFRTLRGPAGQNSSTTPNRLAGAAPWETKNSRLLMHPASRAFVEYQPLCTISVASHTPLNVRNAAGISTPLYFLLKIRRLSNSAFSRLKKSNGNSDSSSRSTACLADSLPVTE